MLGKVFKWQLQQQRKIAELLNRKSSAVIWKWEKFGVTRLNIREELKAMSRNKINDFSKED